MLTLSTSRCSISTVSRVAIVLALVSCGRNPTGPTQVFQTNTNPPRPPSPVPASYRIAAYVTATDLNPIDSAHVEIIDGSYAGAFCKTDQTGQCTLAPLFNGEVTPTVLVSTDGFEPLIHNSDFTRQIQDGTVTLKMTLKPLRPGAIAGVYTLTTVASSMCTDLSNADRTWTNIAAITQDPVNAHYLGLTTIGTPGWCGFNGELMGDSVTFWNDPDCGSYDQPQLVLAQSESGHVFVVGPATIGGGLATMRGHIVGATLTATLDGSLQITDGSSTRTCRAADHQLILTRHPEPGTSALARGR
jgi:hypothetical protein